MKRSSWLSAGLAVLTIGVCVVFARANDLPAQLNPKQSAPPPQVQAVPASPAAAHKPEDFGVSFDSTVPDSLQTLVLNDLAFIADVQGDFASPLNRQIFGEKPLNGANYIAFLKRRVNTIGLNDHITSTTTLIYVNGGATDAKIWLTQNYVPLTNAMAMPQVSRATLPFHEARHKDPGYGFHVKCPKDVADFAGTENCDASATGAYGLQVIMLKNIEFACTGCTLKVRTDADTWAAYWIKRIIDSDARKALQNDQSNMSGWLVPRRHQK